MSEPEKPDGEPKQAADEYGAVKRTRHVPYRTRTPGSNRTHLGVLNRIGKAQKVVCHGPHGFAHRR